MRTVAKKIARKLVLGLGQTSLFSCAEPNANDLHIKSLFELISIRFGARKERRLS